ncbi:MAG TPA: hypothetical protein VEK34_12930 [Methylocella sp.]|nr:hypothetical protein [Methylocella sp.]
MRTEHSQDKQKHSPQTDRAAEEAKKKRLQEDLDSELADTFPASDPPSSTQPAPHPGTPQRN